jgi:hypothetical protein
MTGRDEGGGVMVSAELRDRPQQLRGKRRGRPTGVSS